MKRETGSHLMADLRNYRWAASWGDELLADIKQWYIAGHADLKKHPDAPEFPMPWNEIGTEEPEPEITPEERDNLREQLRKRSAFRD